MRTTSTCTTSAVLSLLALAVAAPAFAAPPPNDARSAAITITPPATVSGSTIDSTLEADEPPACQPLRGSLFYEFRATSTDRLAVRLRASGDLDATVDVFLRTCSQLTPVACETTDRNGNAALDFVPQKGESYVVRVGQRANSAPGEFRLDVFAPEPPPRGPGAALPSGGARGVLDSLQHTRDAYAYRMHAGTPYRLNVAAGACVTLHVYAPGTRDLDRSSPVRSASCDGYLLFTPGAGEGGRYSLVVQAQSRRDGEQRYHLQAAPAGTDDISPGLPLANPDRRARQPAGQPGRHAGPVPVQRVATQRARPLAALRRLGHSHDVAARRSRPQPRGRRVRALTTVVAGALLRRGAHARRRVRPLRPAAPVAHDHADAHHDQRHGQCAVGARPDRAHRRERSPAAPPAR